MMYHLKPLFIRDKVDGFPVNKVFVDDGAAVNLIPQYLLKKIGKFNINLRPHNMVVSNYEGKICHTLGVLQVDLTVESITRPTMLIVISSKVNCNFLLRRE